MEVQLESKRSDLPCVRITGSFIDGLPTGEEFPAEQLWSEPIELDEEYSFVRRGSKRGEFMKRLSMNTKINVFLSSLLLVIGPTAIAQVRPAATGSARIGTFISFGGLRTHVIDYTYNALGVEGGAFVQRSPLVGVELRVASYPLYARYSQTPLTAGWRVEVVQPGIPGMRFSSYIGGGMSRAQDAGAHYAALPPEWFPCWQGSESASIGKGALSLRPVEATFTRTYTNQRTLQGFSLTTGLSYRFSLRGSRP